MIEKSAIELLLEMAKTNETLRRNIGNLMMFGYWESKYYNFEDMIKDEFPELLRLYTPWGYDMHCMGVFRPQPTRRSLLVCRACPDSGTNLPKITATALSGRFLCLRNALFSTNGTKHVYSVNI